jgi:hypothetical protein
MRRTLALFLILMATALAQQKSDEAVRLPADTDKPEARLIEENEHYRVLRFDLAGESQASVPQRRTDVIIVAFGDGLSLGSAKDANPEKLADGDVRFFQRPVHPAILHSGDSVSETIVVELKDHWDSEIRPCSQPKTCTHAIRVGGAEIGQTTALFSNGFVTAYRHHMDRGGTLTTSYYSSKGKDHLLVVALANLQANFDGTEQELKRGQVFASDASEVEMDAGSHEVSWVVIRVEVPKMPQ